MKKLAFSKELTPRDQDLLDLLAEPDQERFAYRAFAFIDADENLVRVTLSKAVGLFGGRPPAGWTKDDQEERARTALYWTLSDMRSGSGTARITTGVDAYLFEWTHKKLAQEMEQSLPAGASTANRKRTAIRKVHSEMTNTLGREVSAQEAAEETNRRGMISRGILPAIRDGLIARTSDVTGDAAKAADARAYFAEEILHGASPGKLSDEKRLSLVVEYGKAIVTKYGLPDALDGEMLARVSDLLPDTPNTAAYCSAESSRLAEAVRASSDTTGSLTSNEAHALVVAHNERAVMGSGYTALRNSGALVADTDLNESFFAAADLYSTDAPHAHPVPGAGTNLIAPGESSIMVTTLIAAAGKRYPGKTVLIQEMIDCYLAGEQIKPSRRLADQCGMTQAEVAEAIEEIRETMREIVSELLARDEGITTGLITTA